jgi:hypothetical protein
MSVPKLSYDACPYNNAPRSSFRTFGRQRRRRREWQNSIGERGEGLRVTPTAARTDPKSGSKAWTW